MMKYNICMGTLRMWKMLSSLFSLCFTWGKETTYSAGEKVWWFVSFGLIFAGGVLAQHWRKLAEPCPVQVVQITYT